MARPSWLGRAVGNEHHHAIEQASRRWRGGRRDDSARTCRKILISTQVVANINVVVNADLTLTVCDVIEFDASGRVTSLNAFLKKD